MLVKAPRLASYRPPPGARLTKEPRMPVTTIDPNTALVVIDLQQGPAN
jgi:hypothetical protein